MKQVYTLAVAVLFFVCNSFAQGTWSQVTAVAPHNNVGGFMVLSDGSVLCKTNSGGSPANDGNLWDKLTPDIHGSYITGTWSTIAAMTYTRVFFSSQMLKDGRVYVAGGEYGTDGTQKGKHGEVYNPDSNKWTTCSAPGHTISDANSEILPDGRVLQSTIDVPFPTTTLIYDPVANTYSTTGSSHGGQNESAWLKLPDNSILFVDEGALSSERYIPSLNQWVVDANLTDSLYQATTLETGPCFLLPNGKAIFFGCPHTAIYTPSGDTSKGSWVAGPDIPNGYAMDDAPGAMMPNGNILIAVDIPSETAPTRFYEYNYLTNSYTQVGAPGGGTSLAGISTYKTTMVVLPTGQVLFGIGQTSTSNIYYIYTPGGTPLAAGKPTISNIAQTSCSAFTITGTLFNGISEGAGYGDDFQMATNYPIIRLTSGTNVYYARTFNWNSTGVQRGTAADTAQFRLPSGLPVATYSLVVTANGISSDPVSFTPFPTAAASSNTPVCAGRNLNLTSGGGATYLWSGPNSFTSTQQNPGISNVTTSAGGTYTVTVTNSGGCTALATTTVTILAQPIVTISNNSPVCAGRTLNLSSSGGTTYSWSGPNSLTSTAQNPTIANSTIAATGTYTVTVSNASGCTTTATTSVTVNGLPAATAGSNSPVCATNSLNLSSSGGTAYSWNGPNSFASTIQNPIILNVTSAASGTYSVTVTNASNCSATATTTVTVNSKPTPSASNNSPACSGNNINLSSTSGSTSYSWSGPNSFSSTSQNPIINSATTAATGTYTVTVTNAVGCFETATTAVTVNTSPTATASSNSPVCAGNTINLSGSGAINYSWNGPNGFSSTNQNPTITNSITANSGTYSLTVTDNNACTGAASATVTVNNCSPGALNLTAFLQGFYTSGGTMRTILFDLSLSTDATATDSITINLWLPVHLVNTSPDYFVKTILHKDGTASAAFPFSVVGNSYYIAVKHRNTIETWSHNPVLFSAVTSYNFSTSITQAYSNGINAPMENMGDGIYAFYSGDANQDGTIDAGDMSLTDNDVQHFAFGYNATDCNGNGATDAADLSIIDNNTQLFLFFARP